MLNVQSFFKSYCQVKCICPGLFLPPTSTSPHPTDRLVPEVSHLWLQVSMACKKNLELLVQCSSSIKNNSVRLNKLLNKSDPLCVCFLTLFVLCSIELQRMSYSNTFTFYNKNIAQKVNYLYIDISFLFKYLFSYKEAYESVWMMKQKCLHKNTFNIFLLGVGAL